MIIKAGDYYNGFKFLVMVAVQNIAQISVKLALETKVMEKYRSSASFPAAEPSFTYPFCTMLPV